MSQLVKRTGKYPPQYIGACDTASVNFLIAFLDYETFDCYLFKHNFKVNNPEFKQNSIQESLYNEVLEYHKDFFDRTLFFTIETNHHRVRREVADVFMILRALIKGRYGDMPQYVMTGGDVRSSYNIPSNKSHRARKAMSGDSNILSYRQTVGLLRAFNGKIDDAQDTINLLFAAYRKFFLSQEGMRPGQWKKIKVDDILLHKRVALQALEEQQILKRTQKQTIIERVIERQQQELEKRHKREIEEKKIEQIKPKQEKKTVIFIIDDDKNEKESTTTKRKKEINLTVETPKKKVKITNDDTKKRKKLGPICQSAGHKKKRR